MGCGKQREATASIKSLVKPQPWFLSLRWKTCLRQNCSLGFSACRERPAFGQNTDDDEGWDSPYALSPRKIYCGHLNMGNGWYESYPVVICPCLQVHLSRSISTNTGLILSLLAWVLGRRMVISRRRDVLADLQHNCTGYLSEYMLSMYISLFPCTVPMLDVNIEL